MHIYNNTATRVSEAEQIGRDKFISIHSGMTWTPMPDRYEVVDLSGATHINMYIEAKGRNIKSTDYGTTFLELKKLDNLLDIAKANNGKAFYFVTYIDGKSFLFDLTHVKEKYSVQQQWMNDITIGDYATQKVLKDVIHLPLFAADRRYK
ncbi:hypothetical protein SAMN04487898_105137 [Pedobacter sp. ok626]|uniref:hypothetical protein n=1 Tax=Pedobacter sp. ok626 TaxID=1761882 RepID=UPI00088544E6|nr:hypothetical protein [Pedobacter sp. ok626]SDJ95261.1 hypothetical protein SAMN04487898_105137 [Pedobacter sp. ok626]